MHYDAFCSCFVGFLGWAFYELSGGAEFDPSAIREARLAAEAEKEAELQVAQAAAAAAVSTPVVLAEAPRVTVASNTSTAAEPEVTRVALNLTTLDNTDEPAGIISPATSDPVPENVSVVTASAETQAIIPSLIDPNDGATTAVEPISTEPTEIRTVEGNRVNVRGGPGTDFGVVGRLVRGDEIRVLENNGAGWVRFEAVDGSTDGWMAEFLLFDS